MWGSNSKFMLNWQDQLSDAWAVCQPVLQEQVSFLCDSYLDECFPKKKKFTIYFFLIRNIALLLGYRNAILVWNSEIYPTEGSRRPRSRRGEALGLCGGALSGRPVELLGPFVVRMPQRTLSFSHPVIRVLRTLDTTLCGSAITKNISAFRKPKLSCTIRRTVFAFSREVTSKS